MHEARSSYLKTIALFASVSLAAGLAAAFTPAGALSGLAGALFGLLAAGCGLVVLAGLLVLWRERRDARGEDLFLQANASRYEPFLALDGPFNAAARNGYRWLARLLTGERFLVGDVVEVRSFDEIRPTLDSRGCLDGLPFMPEMLPFCGRRLRVFRCLDKVYDYGGRKNLRRIRNTVLLTGLRCDGSAHDACQARCYLMWKTAWLKPAPPATSVPAPVPALAAAEGLRTRESGRYVCQYTEVVPASTSLRPWALGQDLRPLLTGNVTLRAFVVAMLTRLFNAVQSWRGGTGYPARPPGGGVCSPAETGLQLGERVRVRDAAAIAATLNANGKNRGLWFDGDMLKHCGRIYPVLARVQRIIDDATGRMIPMKTPCIILDDVYTSGETLRFCAQHDYAFWREAWLERVETRPKSASSQPRQG